MTTIEILAIAAGSILGFAAADGFGLVIDILHDHKLSKQEDLHEDDALPRGHGDGYES